MKINLKKPLLFIAVPLLVGGAAGLLTAGGVERFASQPQPPLSPPAWLFPVVWTFLYILMGTASYLVSQSDASRTVRNSALSFYGYQLTLNFLWPIIFFIMEMYAVAAFWLGVLLLLVLYTSKLFYRIDKTAGYLMVPYVLWLIFALYLNIGVAVLNPM